MADEATPPSDNPSPSTPTDTATGTATPPDSPPPAPAGGDTPPPADPAADIFEHPLPKGHTSKDLMERKAIKRARQTRSKTLQE
jgi:hypothetical protein